MKPLNRFNHDLLEKIISVWRAQKQESYLVGGALRDALLGRLAFNADLDLLVPRDALAVARRLADILGAMFYPVDAVRGVGRVIFADRRYLDITDFRAPTLAGDLRDRDFTINAIALNLHDFSLIDPTGGQKDLHEKIIRVASDLAIQNDPLRALRGIRLAQTLGFQIEGETGRRISAGVAGLNRISAERMRDELQKLLRAPSLAVAMDMLRHYGVLAEILPETLAMVGVAQSPPHHLPVWEHSLQTMDNWQAIASLDVPELAEFQPRLTEYFQAELPGVLTRAVLMPWIGLLHDAGKPQTQSVDDGGRIRFFGHEKVSAKLAKTVMRRFHFSERATKFVVRAVRHHMRPLLLANESTVSARAIHRLLVAAGDTVPAVAVFALCDHRATYPPGQGAAQRSRLLAVIRRLLAAYFAPKPARLLSGAEVMAALGVPESPKIGEWLRRLDEAQAVGEITTKEEALAFLKK